MQIQITLPLEIEEWRPVAGFEQTHSVSSLGRLRRDVFRHNPTRALQNAGILKSRVGNVGYPLVWLIDGAGHKRHTPLHRVVAEAFHGPPPTGCVANHIDGNKLNNRADNLEWVTSSENNVHALVTKLRRNPRVRFGSEHPTSKLTEDQVREIRASTELLRVVAARYGMGISQVHRIRHGAAWGHLA